MRRKGLSPFKAGMIALVVVVVGCYLGFTKTIPFQQHFEIKAAFRSSNNIKKNSPVRVAGVEIGRVSKVEPTSAGADSAVVTLRIKDNGRPIHVDATAKIRPRIFLEGNFFVDLTAGSPGAAELGDGDTIPATQTATPVQFDEVLKALKAPTRQAAQKTIGELANAYKAGFAKSFNDTLDDQAPAFRYTSIVLDSLLGREPHDLSNVVRDLGKTSAALDRSPPRLKSLLTNFNRTAAALASERDNLEATVQELPRTMEAAGPALDELNNAFPSVRRFATAALPGVRSSGPAVAALRPFIAQARGLVGRNELRGLTSALRAATPGLVGLSTRSVPFLGQNRLLSSCLNSVVLPWSEDTVPDTAFPASGPAYQEAAKFLPGLGGESRSYDANGPWMKVLGSGGAETVQLGNGVFGFPISNLSGVNPPKPAGRPPLEPDVPCETQEKPNLQSIAQGPPATTGQSGSGLPVELPPIVRKRYEKAKETAIIETREALRREGIDAKATTKDATRAMVDAQARRAGNMDQLEVLRDGLPLTPSNIRKAGGK
jgi:phospholipid/cholesterol/gamma-HCH transport system substrate-binding protein